MNKKSIFIINMLMFTAFTFSSITYFLDKNTKSSIYFATLALLMLTLSIYTYNNYKQK